jgi:hypothetical protein
MNRIHVRKLLSFIAVLTLAACSSTPPTEPEQARSSLVCDSYIVLDMCVQDVGGDGTVDMVYFSDTSEIFMYRTGQKQAVAEYLDFHRCAVPLNPGMQKITNRILHRKNMSMTEELDIARQLVANYMAAKPEIDACNSRFDAAAGSGLALQPRAQPRHRRHYP